MKNNFYETPCILEKEKVFIQLFTGDYPSDAQLKINVSSSNDAYFLTKQFSYYTNNMISTKFIRVKSHILVSKSVQEKLIFACSLFIS